MNLENKTILITGASDGIGKTTAIRLAKEKGVSLVLLGRNEKKLDNTKEKCLQKGALKATIYAFDLSKSSDMKYQRKS